MWLACKLEAHCEIDMLTYALIGQYYRQWPAKYIDRIDLHAMMLHTVHCVAVY